jgi:hypothetical protein
VALAPSTNGELVTFYDGTIEIGKGITPSFLGTSQLPERFFFASCGRRER